MVEQEQTSMTSCEALAADAKEEQQMQRTLSWATQGGGVGLVRLISVVGIRFRALLF